MRVKQTEVVFRDPVTFEIVYRDTFDTTTLDAVRYHQVNQCYQWCMVEKYER